MKGDGRPCVLGGLAYIFWNSCSFFLLASSLDAGRVLDLKGSGPWAIRGTGRGPGSP